MRIFVTGATGFVGSAIVQELLSAGHTVLGLTRSESGRRQLEAVGADVHRGSLEDLGSLQAGAQAADAVIHTAFNHDFSRFAENCANDRLVIDALGMALKGSDRPMVVTAVLAGLAPGRVAVESDQASPAFPRASDLAAAALAAQGVRVTAVRLPPSTHGEGDTIGFVPTMIDLARKTGVSAYVGDGQNRWPAVHRRDAARLYRMAIEQGVEQGPFHAVDDEGVPVKQIAEVIARRLGVPLVSLSENEVAGHFGWQAKFAGMDAASSSAHTRSVLGWVPTQPGLLEDIDGPAYFGG
jgi:nucleoside-diphosphate-sugar epimerase